MDHLNSLLIDGTLITNPEVVATNNENRLVKFSIASDRVFIDTEGNKQKETLFLPVVAYGSLAGLCINHLEKEITVRIAGRLKMARWKTTAGEERTNIELIAQHVEFKRCATQMSKKKEETIVFEEKEGESDSLC